MKKYKKEADPMQKVSNGTITENDNEDNNSSNGRRVDSDREVTDHTRAIHFKRGIREERNRTAMGQDEGETSSYGSNQLEQLKVILKADSIQVGSEMGQRSEHGALKSSNQVKRDVGV